jgi:hypothetical protein
MSSADFGGSANRGGGDSSSSGCWSSTAWQATSPATVRTAAAIAWWTCAFTSRWAASVPAREPMSAPRLHIPCRPDMIDLPSRFSTSTPIAFITTSAMPAVAP